MNFLPILEKKREKLALSDQEIAFFVSGATSGAIPDYQLSAFLMATYFVGLNADETRALTLAMRDSGEVLQWENDGRPVVDKHSTGGIGDKVSLPLAPLLACLGFRVPMISGRGLGITGGTLDKLESIEGFGTRFEAAQIQRITNEIGCCIVGQSEKMVPADKKLYELRDASATVPSIALITASILSKKLAEGLDSLVLDVKWGRAAFMKTQNDAQKLADAMESLGNACGTKTTAITNEMNQPTGRTAGNWLEVVEAVECLENRGPDDLRDLVLRLASDLLISTGLETTVENALSRSKTMLESGAPREKWNQMLIAQGADLGAFETKLQAALDTEIVILKSPRSGKIADVNARIIGEWVRDMGGGRLEQNAGIDHRVGVSHIVQKGESVERGDALCWVHTDKLNGNDSILSAAWSFEE